MTPATDTPAMKYRFLGNSGLLVSMLSYGCMTFVEDTSVDTAYEILKAAYQAGINFIDNAEAYTAGVAETTMGQAVQRGIADGIWTREDLVLTTKIFMGTKPGPNNCGLGRKHLIEGAKASLKRMQLDYVDVIFCHRPEPLTPIEETVRAMNFIIEQGWAFYWGTSDWLSHEIDEACTIADRLGLIRPVTEQPQYNIIERSRVDVDYLNLYKKYGLGLTVWSPLAFGLLTGKYANGIPEGSRLYKSRYTKEFLDRYVGDRDRVIALTTDLQVVADELGCSMAQLALAWCMSNPNVSTTMMGGTSVKHIQENVQALAFVDKITPEIKAKVDQIVSYVPTQAKRDQHPDRRRVYL